MAKRSRRAASAGQDARSERPATGMGSPEPDTRASITCEPYDLVARSCPSARARQVAPTVAAVNRHLPLRFEVIQSIETLV